MVQINFRRRRIEVKLVLWGPTGAGKSTTLRTICEALPGSDAFWVAGQFCANVDPGTFGFSAEPKEVQTGRVGGMTTRFQVYACDADSSQAAAFLQGADGVAFCAGAGRPIPDLLGDLVRMKTLLRAQGLDPSTIPLVFQWNQRDREGAPASELLERTLNPSGRDSFETVAIRREGVLALFAKLGGLVLDKLDQEYCQCMFDPDRVAHGSGC